MRGGLKLMKLSPLQGPLGGKTLGILLLSFHRYDQQVPFLPRGENK